MRSNDWLKTFNNQTNSGKGFLLGGIYTAIHCFKQKHRKTQTKIITLEPESEHYFHSRVLVPSTAWSATRSPFAEFGVCIDLHFTYLMN